MVHGFVKAPAWEPADPGLKATKESLVGKGAQADKGHLKRFPPFPAPAKNAEPMTLCRAEGH